MVALDWKWLFIYPDQGIATVNEIVFPANTPVNFKITSDTVMNSFFIPQLGSQIYAMAGMQTQLHLIADADRASTTVSPPTTAAPASRHEVQGHRHLAGRFRRLGREGQGLRNSSTLDTYDAPRQAEPRTTRSSYYSPVTPILFQTIVDKYMDKPAGREARADERTACRQGRGRESH